MINHPLQKIINLNDYIDVEELPEKPWIWSVDNDWGSPSLTIAEGSLVSLSNPEKSGLYAATVRVSNGSVTSTQTICIKISHFILAKGFYTSPIVLAPYEEHISEESLYDGIFPHDFPRNQIEFVLPSLLPEGIEEARVLASGQIYVRAAANPPARLIQFPVVAHYREPSPTPIVVPTIIPTVITQSPQRDASFTPIPRRTPTATPSPSMNLHIASPEKEFVFSLNRIETVGLNPLDLSIMDINRDSWPDFITGDFGSTTATLLSSQRDNKSYRTDTLDAGGEGCLSVSTGDLDGDGWEDLILLAGFDSRIRIYWGEDSFQWKAWTDIDLPFLVSLPDEQNHSARLRPIAVGRFGVREGLNIAASGEKHLALYSVDTNRIIYLDRRMSLNVEPVALFPVDLDGDGWQELAYTHIRPCGITVESFQDGKQRRILSRNLEFELAGDVPYGLLSGRFNPDSFLDLAVFTFSGMLHTGFGNGRYGVEWNCFSTPDFLMRDWTGGDYDGDGRTELLLAGWDIPLKTPAVGVVCLADTGRYEDCRINPIPRTFPLNQVFTVTSVFLDNDELPDLVMTDRTQNQLVFFLNQTPRHTDRTPTQLP